MASAARKGESFTSPPSTTAIGALLNHITGGHIEVIDGGPSSFQPMNANFGLFPPLSEKISAEGGKRLRGPAKAAAKKRALGLRAAARVRDLACRSVRPRGPNDKTDIKSDLFT